MHSPEDSGGHSTKDGEKEIPLQDLSPPSSSSSPSASLYITAATEMEESEMEGYRPPEGCSPPPEMELDYDDHHSDAPIISARPSNGKGVRWKKRPDAAQGFMSDEQWERFNDRVGVFIEKTMEIFWRIMEVHITRIVLLVILSVIVLRQSKDASDNAVLHYEALNLPLVILICVAVILPRGASNVACLVVCLYICALAIVKMALNNIDKNLIPPFNPPSPNCTTGNVTYMQWMGFRKAEEDNTWSLVKDLLVSILLLAIQSVVFYRMKYLRSEKGEAKPNQRILVFPSFAPADLDKGLCASLAWLVDYTFYKFGVEISVIALSIDVWVRMDGIAVISCAFIVIIVLSPRSLVRAVWPVLMAYLAIMIPLQYAMHVGLPPAECQEYPWQPFAKEPPMPQPLAVMLSLPLYKVPWQASYFVLDFLALLCVAAQLFVFHEESVNHPAGDNKSIYVSREFRIYPENPHYDFVTKQKSFVDYAKIVVFQYGHWVSLLFVLIAGLGGTSLFALGYIVLSLSMLWEGNNLYLMKNHRRTIWRWKLVLLYTSVVMMCKVALQLIGCLSISPANIETNLCVIAQLFAIKCVCNNVIGSSPKEEYVQNNCAVGDGEAAIGFDAFALAFALFQIRVICSWYFQYCVIEFRSEIVLANRGAVLSNQLIEKEMKEQEEQQTRKFAEIKDRTKSIRERYEELQRNDVIDPDSYAHGARRRRLDSGSEIDVDDPFPYYDCRWDRPVDAKRAGDYYMFDYDPARDELKKDKESFVPEADPGSTEFNKLDPTQLAYAAVTKNLDLKGVVDSVEDAESRAAQEAEALGTRADKKKMVLDVVKNDKSKSRSVSSVGEGTSGAQVQSETEEDETQEEEKEPENESTIVSVGRFIGKCVSSTMDWFAAFFNRRSREHRYVAYVLSKERQKLKQKKAENLNDISRRLSDVYSDARGESGIILVASESDISKMEEAAANSWQKKNVLARLINAFGHCVAAHTDILCYMIVFICHARGAGLITLPLPAFVLFWGTLSNPRPSKFFWVTLILYTEIILVIKFIFQFGFWPMNSFDSVTKAKNEPYSWPALLGVQKAESYCFWEVALLMALFFHRYMLRKLGLWKDANVSETFDGEQPNGGGNSGERGISNPALDTPESSPREEEEAVGEGRGVLGPLYSIREESSPGKYSRNGPSEAVESVEASNVGGEVRELDYAVYAPGGEDEVDGGEADKQRSGFGRFIYQLLFPKFRDIRDLYPAMFGLDVLCFLIIIFSYSSFGDGGSGSGVLSDIQNNRVPITFVIMMIVLSFLMVIDRGLYLRKAVRCKLVFQALLIIFMHVWIFFVLPWITKKQACTNKGAQVIYVVKCIYFLFSAWQIRNGYPQLCVGNLIMHSYGLANLVFFKVFMLVPFVFELRTAIDWTWTDTSMPLFDFFNMEQFYATIYNLKCMRSFEDAYPAARGEKKGALVKYAMGLSFVIILILLIWCPLVAFALLNKVGQSNPPDHVRLSVAIQGYPPLYTIESQGLELQPVTYKQFEDMKDNYAKWASKTNRTVKLNEEEVGQASRTAVAFIDDFSQEDVYLIQFRPESQSRWEISNASTAALSDMLQNYKPESLLDDDPKRVTIDVLLTVTRRRFDKQKEPQTHTATFSSGVDADLRDRILKALKDKSENVIIPSVFPRAIHIPSEGEVTAASALLNLALDQDFATTSPAKKHPEQSKINLRYQNIDSVWTAQVRDNSSQFAIDQLLIPPSDITYVSPYAAQGEKLKYLEMVAFTTRVFPSFLSKFVSGGIIAMYFALVLLAGRVIRGVLTNSPLNVMITEIPNPDHLLKICLDIYLVREAKDFVLEQDLFAKLIFLFRSPSTLIKWTRLRPSKKND